MCVYYTIECILKIWIVTIIIYVVFQTGIAWYACSIIHYVKCDVFSIMFKCSCGNRIDRLIIYVVLFELQSGPWEWSPSKKKWALRAHNFSTSSIFPLPQKKVIP